MAEEENRESLSCEICGKECTGFKRLKKHYGRKHPEYELVFCPLCDHLTTQTSQIKRHMKILHPGIKFACHSCDFFTQKWKKWRRHLASHHSDESEEIVLTKTDHDTVTTSLENPTRSQQSTEYNEIMKTRPSLQSKERKIASDSSANLNDGVTNKEGVISEDTSPRCSLCGHESTSFRRLKKHFRKKHPEAEVMCCSNCDFAALEEHELDKHVRNQHSKHSSADNVMIQEQIKEEPEMETDQNISAADVNSSTRVVSSPEISNGFHLDSKSNSFTNDDLLAFTDSAIDSTPLQGAKDTENSKKKYSCPHCSMTTQYPSSFKEHMLTHSGKRPYVCSVCDKTFVTIRGLKRHKPLHSLECPHVCEYCEFATRDEANLRQHLRSHLDIRPYKCTFCDFATSHRTAITYHIRKHKGIRPYVCDYCQKTFISKWNMQVHMRTRHLHGK